MKRLANRGLAMLMALVMCFSLLPVMEFTASAATVDYVYSDDENQYIYNWGTRGTVATFLSPNAAAFYANDTYEELSALAGGTGTSDAPSSALYGALQDLMENAHSYVNDYEALKTLMQYTDCEESNKTTISCFYTGTALSSSWDETWDREHTWPNSKGDASGLGENDLMMLRPALKAANNKRSNSAYGTTTDGTYFYPNYYYTDGKYDVRGDAARALLYIYVRWENNALDVWGSSGVIESMELLMEWMAADPVDTWEMGRNDSVQSITGTRNVFIDYPELAFQLFGREMPDTYMTPSGASAGDGHTHAFTSTITTGATCATHGLRTYTCSCPVSYTEVIFANGHSFVNGICDVCQAVEPVEYTATLVTNASNLSVGDQIIIVAKEYDKAMSTTHNSNGNNRGQAAITKSEDGSTITFNLADGVQIITLEAGNKAGSFAFPVDGGYLYAASSSSNNMKIEATLSDNSSWSISIADGTASVVAQGTNTRNVLQYNTSGMFSTYSATSNMKPIAVYLIDDGNDDGGESGGEGGEAECTHTNTQVLPAKAATCTETGLTEGNKCTDCGEVLVSQNVVPATGHNYVDGTCTGCGKSETVWTKVELKDITSSDTVAITMTKGSDTWALYNDNGTGGAPTAVVVTVDGDYMTSEELEKISWNITSDANGLAIYKGGSNTDYLYCISNNNGARVGSTDTSADSMYWELDSNYLKNTVRARYMGVYNAQDWRTYTSINNNITGQTLTFWKLGRIVSGGEGGDEVECSHVYGDPVITEATCTTAGKKVYTCTNDGCDHSYEETIPATDHNFVDGTCSDCGLLESYDGKTVMIYYPAGDLYVTSTASGSKLAGGTEAEAAAWVMTINGDGYYSFVLNNKYLTSGTTGNSLSLSDTLTDCGLWEVIPCDNGCYLHNVGAAYSGNHNQYLEYFSGFTTYGFNESNTAIYTFQLNILEGEICSHVYGDPVITEPTCTTAGKKVYTCTNNGCGYSYEETIPATGHSYTDGICTGCGAAEPAAADATLSFADKANRTSYDTSKQVWVQNGITVTNDKASSTTNVGDYYNPARFYKSSNVTIAYPGMTKIEIGCTGLDAKYVTAWEHTASGVTVTIENQIVTITFTAPVDTYTVTGLSAQARANSIAVYAEAGGSGETGGESGGVNYYTISLDANGGRVNVESVQTDAEGKVSELPTPTRSGYTFNGWYTDEACTTAFNLSTVLTADITLYAKWTAKPVAPVYPSYPSIPSIPSGSTTTTTTKNEDGSTTTTKTDKVSGTVTETTKHTNGTTATVTTTADGTVETEVVLSTKAVEEAAKAGEAVELPIEAVAIVTDSTEAPTITIGAKSGSNAKIPVLVPVVEASESTVVILVNADGTETVMMDTKLDENGLVVDVPGGAVVKVVDNAVEFTDVSKKDWESKAVNYTSARGLMQGVSGEENVFSLDSNTTFTQLVTMLARLDGENTTPDSGEKWYTKGMEWAEENGITYGGEIDRTIKRQDLINVLWKAAGCPESDQDLSGFSDASDLTDENLAAARWAVEFGILKGDGKGVMSPNGRVTRGQMAQFLMNFIQNGAN